MIVCAVTLLPEPDSPTIASTSPGARSKRDAVDRLQQPAFGGEADPQVARRESSAAALIAPTVPEPHPRVEVGVGDVDEGVEEDDEEGAEEGDRHDRRQVEVGRSLRRRSGRRR